MDIATSKDEDFAARLGQYGLQRQDLLRDQLSTVPSSVTRLAMDHADASLRPIVLRTDDFDELSRWIGVHDAVFDSVPPLAEPPRGVARRVMAAPRPATADAAPSLAHADPALAHEVARAYLFGDSRPLKPLKPWLSHMFPAVSVAVWAFLDIRVRSGSVLEFGPGPNVLVARSLTIEPGGKVRSLGHLKVDLVTLEKPGRFKASVALDPALAATRPFA